MNPKEMKSEWLESQASSWDDSLARLQETWKDYPEEVEFLCDKFKIFLDLLLVPVELGEDFSKFRYGTPEFDPVSFMDFISWFISHEIYDDGEPQVYYFRKDTAPIQDFINLSQEERKDWMRRRVNAPTILVPPKEARGCVIIRNWAGDQKPHRYLDFAALKEAISFEENLQEEIHKAITRFRGPEKETPPRKEFLFLKNLPKHFAMLGNPRNCADRP